MSFHACKILFKLVQVSAECLGGLTFSWTQRIWVYYATTEFSDVQKHHKNTSI